MTLVKVATLAKLVIPVKLVSLVKLENLVKLMALSEKQKVGSGPLVPLSELTRHVDQKTN